MLTVMNSTTIEQSILDKARQLGFVAAGIALVAPSDAYGPFSRWLESGQAAGMDFLKRSAPLRADIRNVVPEAKSVIVVAARYPANQAPGSGFSTCSRGVDYHLVIREKLSQLATHTREITEVVTRICVDSTPVLEREWAVRAGIGWQGKQGQIVHPEYGCCITLGELVVSISLEPSNPIPNQCGTCRRCLDACPTQAIAEGRLIDCRRCIAYLTVEEKGEIPKDLQPLMGQALFGCDFCTAACPWNKPGLENIMPEFHEQVTPTPGELLTMAKSEFKKRFKTSAFLRTGLARLQRNAALALGKESRQT